MATTVSSKVFRVAIVGLFGIVACHRGQPRSSGIPDGCPPGIIGDTTPTGVPRTQLCGERARRGLAQLIREMPRDTSIARLTDLIRQTQYPDEHLLDAALEVAVRRDVTRAARITALMIVTQQAYGWTAGPVVVNSAGGREGITPYSTGLHRCSLASVPVLSMYPMPDPPLAALERMRTALAPIATAADDDPIIRDLARCILHP